MPPHVRSATASPITPRRRSSAKAPRVGSSNSAWVSTFRLAGERRRSSQTCAVTWTRHVGRQILDTASRTVCLLNTRWRLMSSVCRSARRSRPWEEQDLSSAVLSPRQLAGTKWPQKPCLLPRGGLKVDSREASEWVWALQLMVGTVAATALLILVHRQCRLGRHSPESRTVVTRRLCKVYFPPICLSKATTSGCSAVHLSAWSTTVCQQAQRETSRPRCPAPACLRHRRLPS